VSSNHALSSIGALAGHPIIPVIVIDDAAHAEGVANALLDGGISCAEVTFRTPAAAAAIRAMAGVPGFTVGAGTVISFDQLEVATDAGATFIVSPGLDPELVSAVRSRSLGILPGVATATEVLTAIRAGLDAVKFFPADQLGGLAMIRALAAPFPQIGFIPSGGVNAENAAEYLADGAVPAVSGSWMAPADLIAAANFGEIERRTAVAVSKLGLT
jgi:2-dehydro-3-deoxyphosphogluconate aldolase / (4S)-4-hydroxy-2-oxoglutarate aldolase